MCYVTKNQIYQVIRPRINGYIVNCTRFCTKVARNFVLRCFEHPIQRRSESVVIICG